MSMSHGERAERRKAIYNDHKKGMSLTELATKYGLSLQTIFKAIKEIGGVRPMQTTRNAVKAFTILKMLMDGCTSKEITEKLMISLQRVSEVRNNAKEVGLL